MSDPLLSMIGKTHNMEKVRLRMRIAALEDAIRPLAAHADAMDRAYGEDRCADDALCAVLEYGEARKLRDLLQQQ